MTAKEIDHSGHRERLKNRYKTEGLDHFDEINVLELLLFYCIPKQDTNPIAHRLLDEFGSLKRVFEADIAALKGVKGMGDHSALFISMMKDISRYYGVKCAQTMPAMKTLNDCGNYMKEYFVGRTTETVFLLCLDAKSAVISCRKVSEGSVNATSVSVRRISEIAVQDKATSVVLGHNHPSGVAIPSTEDIQTTLHIKNALAGLDIQLLDHFIFAGNDFVSLYQSSLIM